MNNSVGVHIVSTPPSSRGGPREFSINFYAGGLGFFENQGGVVNIGWAYIFQGGVELSFVTMLLVDIF